MRRFIILVILVLVPHIALGDRGTFEARVIALKESGKDQYVLHMVQLSEPYGYQHTKDKELVIHLRFECPLYQCNNADTQPTLGKYQQAITLLKDQIKSSKTIEFGIVDRGFAEIKGTKNEYQSNDLEVYQGTVYSDYDFFDF